MRNTNQISVLFMVLLTALVNLQPAYASEKPMPPDDQTITRWVEAALAADPRIDANEVGIQTVDGIVTLEGQVHNLAEKHYADLEAKTIKGVLGVINRIETKTVHRHDADIRLLIRRSIINSAVISSQNIGVVVNNGEVTLSGTVDSFVEKEQAGVLATEIRGVTAVNNAIEVAYKHKRTDAQIIEDVKTRLGLDVYLSGIHIAASVTDGMVTLEGMVQSPYQMDRAFMDVYVIQNVVDVHNKLKVAWGPNKINAPENRLSDTQLSRTIQNQLALNLRIEHPWDIQVQVQRGHVTLNGTVATYQQRLLASRDANDVIGVAWISNMISVKAVPRSDSSIIEDARFNIDADYALLGDIIKVFVRDGKALLTGTVQSYFQKARAENDVGRIVGVKDVVDALDVNPHPKVSDAGLKEHIMQRLAANWATWTVSNKIKVTVQDSKVTIAGQVDTWQQRREAGRIAILTKGALAVDNRLIVLGNPYDWDKWYGTTSKGFVYDPYFNEDPFIYPDGGKAE